MRGWLFLHNALPGSKVPIEIGNMLGLWDLLEAQRKVGQWFYIRDIIEKGIDFAILGIKTATGRATGQMIPNTWLVKCVRAEREQFLAVSASKRQRFRH
jgi:hypothetical protein